MSWLIRVVLAYNETSWLPFKLNDLLCMSFGWMTNTTSSNIMRGPMVMSIVEQILNNTMWGDLDYLVLDLPPGTGDVQLSLCQKLSLSGSVIVTTPQILSVADTEKGIRMFSKLKVPINAIVENMSFFKCKHGETYYPFGLLVQLGSRRRNQQSGHADEEVQDRPSLHAPHRSVAFQVGRASRGVLAPGVARQRHFQHDCGIRGAWRRL